MKHKSARSLMVLLLLAALLTGSLAACASHTELPAVVTKGLKEEKVASTVHEGDFVFSIHQTYAEVTSYTGKVPTPIIPDTISGLPVLAIGPSAFQDNTDITTVTLPKLLRQIQKHAFDGCTSLVSLTLPETVESLGEYAFKNCAFTELTLPESVAEISKYCFYGCAITSVTIPSRVERTGKYAFYGCQNLISVSFPPRMTSISDKMFYNCTALTEVILPDTMTKIEEYAFSGCTSLKRIVIPASVTVIGAGILHGCPDAVIETTAGSKAETYAQNNQYAVTLIEKK